MGESINDIKLYELRDKDVFSVPLNTYISDSSLWDSHFQIVGVTKIKRKWWQIWKPKHEKFVQIKYIA